jgi:hypothetical protein
VPVDREQVWCGSPSLASVNVAYSPGRPAQSCVTKRALIHRDETRLIASRLEATPADVVAAAPAGLTRRAAGRRSAVAAYAETTVAVRAPAELG